jgi:hypothetical protein
MRTPCTVGDTDADPDGARLSSVGSTEAPSVGDVDSDGSCDSEAGALSDGDADSDPL